MRLAVSLRTAGIAAVMLGAGLLTACAPAAMPLAADHPANPAAPAGRLAGAPPALRPGVASDALVEPEPRTTPTRPRAAVEETPREPAEKATPDKAATKKPAKKPVKKPEKKPPAKPPTGHEGH